MIITLTYINMIITVVIHFVSASALRSQFNMHILSSCRSSLGCRLVVLTNDRGTITHTAVSPQIQTYPTS